MDDHQQAAVAEPVAEEPQGSTVRPKRRSKAKTKGKPRRQPRYHVILWNDDDHSYDYVAEMMRALFGYPAQKGFLIAREVDTTGKAICLTTTMEHAELKRDQIHAYGKDIGIERCSGLMSASIEPQAE